MSSSAAPALYSHREIQAQLAQYALTRDGRQTVEFIRGADFTQEEFAAMLSRLRNSEPALVPVADGLMGSLGFPRQHPMRNAAVALAQEAANDSEEKAPYHNHRHTLDVLCSFWRLGSCKAEGLTREDLASGVLASIAHDLGYDPSTSAGIGDREELSFRRADRELEDRVTLEQRDRIHAMIAGTEISQYAAVKSAYLELGSPENDTEAQRTARMTALLVRADLAASTATTELLNLEMSARLQSETGLDTLGETKSRRAFVAAYAPYTKAEEALGFSKAHARVLNQLDREIDFQAREGQPPADRHPVFGADNPLLRTDELRRAVAVPIEIGLH